MHSGDRLSNSAPSPRRSPPCCSRPWPRAANSRWTTRWSATSPATGGPPPSAPARRSGCCTWPPTPRGSPDCRPGCGPAPPAFFSNPYAAFGDEQLRSGLTRTTVHHRPGSYFAYSNYGVGLLGRLLAETGNGTYAELLADRVCRPLGLRSATTGRDTPGRATGHRRGRPLPPWHIPGLPGAGAVRAGGADLLHYLRAHLSPGGGELGAALRDVQRPRLRLLRSADQLALVWNHRRLDGRDLLFHSGATRGFTAFVGFCPQSATAVAALANCGPALDGRFVQGGYEVLKRLSHGRG
ncbi:serine hydrolase domain-containing protein [Streptomyces sp. CB01881]|uniref:serine hydrolase domain-containing protein n=1 Tax=Streptomyces sp. CB01881 TaxID=2078691 RepID=UPI0023FA134A|nr:serine hydrolase domain-containing protein [Streptomyces sp. CB01881]